MYVMCISVIASIFSKHVLQAGLDREIDIARNYDGDPSSSYLMLEGVC
jgi:hypothetical protein